MRNVFASKSFQAFGAPKPVVGQRTGNAVPLAGASQAKGKAIPVSKPKNGPSTPGKSSFSGDCPICH